MFNLISVLVKLGLGANQIKELINFVKAKSNGRFLALRPGTWNAYNPK